jgi:nitrate reductase gamma subunit
LGLTLGFFGAANLLFLRILKPELRRYSTRADYFNLILLFVIFAAGIAAWLTADRSFGILRGCVNHLMTFKAIGKLPASIKTELALAGIFFIYMPFTHMTHFVGKYFTFHKIRWQDEPIFPGYKSEQAIIRALGQTVAWSAPHIETGKTWAEIVSKPSNEPPEDSR